MNTLYLLAIKIKLWLMWVVDIQEDQCPSCGYYCLNNTVFCTPRIITHKCGDECRHSSDCAIHNEPAYRNGECDCKEGRK